MKPGTELPPDERERRRTLKQERGARYREAHREELRLATAAYRKAHREELAAKQRAYREQHLERERQRVREWKADNPERLRQLWNAYAAAHREMARARSANQHFAAWGAEGKISGRDILNQGIVQDFKCFYCGCPLDDSYHVDHMVPASRGGPNTPGNIVLACSHCNLTKYNKLPDEFEARALLKKCEE